MADISDTIFISHASRDRRIAETVCSALENRGFQCWLANRDVLAGDNFQASVVRAIRTAKVMLLVFTANANNSDEIKKELVLASQNRVIVIPLRVEDVAPDDAFAYELATRQWVDMFENWESALERLVTRLGSFVAHVPQPDVQPVGSDTPEPVAPRPPIDDVPPRKEEPAPTPIVMAVPASTDTKPTLTNDVPPRSDNPAPILIVPDLPVRTATKPATVAAELPATAQTNGAMTPARTGRGSWIAGASVAAFLVVLAVLALSIRHNETPPSPKLSANGGDIKQDNAEGFNASDAIEAMQRRMEQMNSDLQAEAQVKIGALYDNDQGGAKDPAEAMRWYRQAAEQGNARAQRYLGLHYESGVGVTRDLVQARVWMQKAADSGDDVAKQWLKSH